MERLLRTTRWGRITSSAGPFHHQRRCGPSTLPASPSLSNTRPRTSSRDPVGVLVVHRTRDRCDRAGARGRLAARTGLHGDLMNGTLIADVTVRRPTDSFAPSKFVPCSARSRGCPGVAPGSRGEDIGRWGGGGRPSRVEELSDRRAADIEHRFGDRAEAPGGPLGAWRNALSSLTDNGRLDGCSSAFTRRTGLEVVQPAVGQVTSALPSPSPGDVFTVSWDCAHNPVGTEVLVTIRAPDGSQTSSGPLPLTGQLNTPATMPGTYQVYLTAVLQAPSGETRQDSRAFDVMVA